MRIWYRLVTISLTSPKHTCLQSQELTPKSLRPRAYAQELTPKSLRPRAYAQELTPKSFTPKSLRPELTPKSLRPRAYAKSLRPRDRKRDELRYVTARVSHRSTAPTRSAIRKDSAVHVSLLPIQCQTAKSKFKQCSPVKQYNLVNHATDSHLTPKRSLPGLFNRVVLEARETREKRPAPAAQGSVAVDVRLIGRARSHCQPAFSKNFRKARRGCSFPTNSLAFLAT